MYSRCCAGLGDVTSRSDASRNTLGPSLTLELDHILADFNENDREEEVRQVGAQRVLPLAEVQCPMDGVAGGVRMPS